MQQLAVRHWTLRRGADLTEAGRLRAIEWFRAGLLHSADCGGKWRRVDFAGLVSLGVIVGLRRRGLSREAIRPISRFVCGLGAKRLLRCECDGRMLLLSAGARVSLVRPGTQQAAKAAGGVELVIDLQPITARIRERLDATAGQSRPTRNHLAAFPPATTLTGV